MSCSDFPARIVPVALTEAIIIGTAIGNTRIESITSLAFDVADMAEKIVPMVEKPNVPKKIINPNGNRNGNRFTLYRTLNIDSVNISIIAVKMNTPIIFARYIPHGLTGQRSKPGRVPLSRSAPKARLSPIRPENMKATQRIPGMIPC
jgi:hypothetical protein